MLFEALPVSSFGGLTAMSLDLHGDPVKVTVTSILHTPWLHWAVAEDTTNNPHRSTAVTHAILPTRAASRRPMYASPSGWSPGLWCGIPLVLNNRRPNASSTLVCWRRV